MIIDVTERLLPDNKGQVKGRAAKTAAIRAWLEENVGQFYGIDSQLESHTEIGAGWEFTAEHHDNIDGRLDIKWYVDIADEQLATMFALKFT